MIILLLKYLNVWWSKVSVNTVRDRLNIILPGVTLWCIWTSRNKAVFENQGMKCELIIANIKRYVDDLFMAKKLSLPGGNTPTSCKSFFQLCYAEISPTFWIYSYMAPAIWSMV